MATVKVYRSTDYGAPILYGNAGYLIPVLDAALVNGYGSLNVTSMTHSTGTVTVTTASPHLLSTYGRQLIEGANEAGYNGEFQITVTGADTFTYQTTGVVVDTATGTITTKSPGAGWTKPYSGTNLAAYRQGSGNQRYLRIDDTVTLAARCVGYEAMTGISAGTNTFPSTAQFSGGLYWTKSSTADATNARAWVIIADDKTFYMWVNFNSSVTFADSSICAFGDVDSTKSGDLYNCVILANTAAATAANNRFGYVNVNFTTAESGMYFCRSYTQTGTSIAGAKISDAAKAAGATVMGSNGLIYPHQTDGSLYVAPVWTVETASTASQSVIRGSLRGVWNPLHNLPLANLDTFQGNGNLTGKTFLALRMQASGQVFFDIANTW